MHSGNAMTPENPSFATTCGIAALVLEGRPLWEDQYEPDADVQSPDLDAILPADAQTSSAPNSASSLCSSANNSTSGSGTPNNASPDSAAGLPGCSNTPTSSTSGCGGNSSGSSSSGGSRSIPKVWRDETVQHIQRLRNKLMLIRSAPGISRTAVEQAIAVSSGGAHMSEPIDSDDEPDDGFTYDVRSRTFSRLPCTNSNTSGGAPGLLSSLQSLATNSCLNSTPRSMVRADASLYASSGYSTCRLQSSSASATSAAVAAPSSAAAEAEVAAAACSTPPAGAEKTKPKKKIGPHCEEFLKRIGLIKSSAAASDASNSATTTPRSVPRLPSPKVPYVEEHKCNPRTANCKRWIHEYHKLKSIFTTAEAICIDVYLGPDHHAILLEQWTIQQCDRTNQMTMTLPSLCSAIRSQLYFSQISAWSEQLKTARRRDPLIRNNPRLLVIGDTVRLDVHYRIRTFDNTASFTSKPNLHNFPDAIVSDARCIRVSLKSLPRLDAIPTLVVDIPTPSSATNHSVQEATVGAAVAVVAAAAAASATNVGSAFGGPSTSAAASSSSSNRRPMPMSAATTSSSSKRLLNDRQPQQHRCNETGKHQCAAQYDEERTSDESGGSSSPPPSPLENPLLTHRNRQLQKYRKRLLRRDQKKRPQAAAAPSQSSVTATANTTTNTTTTTTTTTVAIVHATTDATDVIDDTTCCKTATGQMISINSIRPPLYSAMESSNGCAIASTAGPASTLPSTYVPSLREDASNNPPPTEAAHTSANCVVEMKSTGTQTSVDCPADMGDDSPVYPNCDLCGIEMQYVCWNCDKKLFERWSSRPASPAQSVIGQRPGTGDCLMQSIQRTPSFRQIQLARQRKSNAASVQLAATTCAVIANANNCDTEPNRQTSTEECLSRSAAVASGSGSSVGRVNDNIDCGLCKRQKKDYLDSPSREGAAVADGSMKNVNNNNESICSYNNVSSSNVRNNNASATMNVFDAMPTDSDYCLDNVAVGSLMKCGGLDEAMPGVFHRRTMSESLDSTPPESAVAAAANAASARYNAEFMLSTSATGGYSTNVHRPANHVISPMSGADLKLYRRAFSEDVLAYGCNDEDNEASRPLVDLKGVPIERNLAGPSKAVFKTPTNLPARSRMIPHQLTISTTNRDLLPPLPMSCSPSSSMSAMSLDSSPLRQPSPGPASSTSTAANLLLTPASAERPLPIVNLSKIFCATPPQALLDDGPQFTFDSVFACAADARPTCIGLVKQRSDFMAGSVDDELLTADDCNAVMGTVHKSNSAPSFAAAAASAASFGSGTSSAHHLLSPRFLKMAAIQKRRSRHLSDRSSERSSIGSDELLSDDELACSRDAQLSMISPNRLARSRLFGRRPLLGSIEESLLQRCFVPTAYVPGFKVLLGASGSFYPTQLTLPTSTSFYELPGQCLSTPYTCEVRMPRKGYAIPRKGIVQVILLNPLGTLVRMFVVPYDLRDMPVLHQTFMRQRVLAFDERLADIQDGAAASACGLTNSEQMKLLRYAIHLRFQTSRSGRLVLHTDIRMVISRRTDCDTAAVYAKRALEAPKDLKVVVLTPDGPKYSPRLD